MELMVSRTPKVMLNRSEHEVVTNVECSVHGPRHLCPLTGVCLACLAANAPVSTLINRWWKDRSGTLSDEVFQNDKGLQS